MPSKSIARLWRAYPARERKQIENHFMEPDGPRCPRCHELLEARPTLKAPVLECRECKRFHVRAQQTAEVLYFMRIQRLASAILHA